ncbi:MAG: selenium-dependent xanthine dehydrogenase [Planctomycetota bacterium]
MTAINFTLNGAPCAVTPEADETLLETLRTRCAITSTKNGCSPQAQCGCCLALIDGAPKTTCALPTSKIAGRDVVTLEGLDEAEREQIAGAFAAAGALQCGFCTPGIALAAKALVDRNEAPSRDEMAKALNVHLCRCTGYLRIFDGIDLLAKARRNGGAIDVCRDGRVGQSLGRYRGEELALGDRPFVADMTEPGMIHGAVVLSPHPRALVKKIDVAAAAAATGVVKVLTADDVPGERYYGLIYADWPGFVAVGEEVRCVGDVLAVVAADTEANARKAADLVAVDYEVREPVLTPERSIEDDAPQVNPVKENRLATTTIRRGDADAALAASAHVVRGTWKTQRIEHLFLEPESAVALPLPDGRLHLKSQGQGVFDDRRQVASFLGLEEDQIFVELIPNGGAFGGKEDMSIQAHAALLAHATGRPAMVTLSREESIRMHPKRHPISMDYVVGCDADGRLTAVQARMLGDTGAYASVGGKVLERAAGHSCGPYRVPNVDVESVAAYTNNPPCGAMRGFGANQAHFALEGAIDMLADAAGIDRWEIRWRNAVEVGDVFCTGQVLEKSVGIRKTLEAIKPHYDQYQQQGKALGIACGIKNSGIGNGAEEWGKARLVVEKDGTISLYNGYTEMGQGLLTVLVQFAVEVTGLPSQLFHPKVDSTYALGCGQTTGSRATLFGGRAVQSAATKLKAALDSGKSLDQLVGEVYAADIVIDDTTAPGQATDKIKTHTAFGYATQLCVLDGDGRVDKVVAAHDVGRVVNPTLCAGQVEGSVHMGLGYALTEDLPCENGMPVTVKLREIGVLRAKDMPDVEVILVEEHEPEGPFGAKGVGEIGLVPTAAAVAGALERFDGERRMTLPMKDSPAAQAMSVGRIRRKK